MSINNNPYDFLNTSALDAMRKLQETSALTAVRELQASSAVTAALKMETTGAFAAVRELQSTLNAVKSSIVTGVVTYLVAHKNASAQIRVVKEQNKHDLEKLMEQHKIDITILIRHTVSMSTKVVEKDKTKNKSSYRSFPLFPEIRELLLQLKEEEQKNREFFGDTYVENDYIFKWANGAMYDPSYISHKFGDLLRKYNLPHIRFHDLRHSCASLLLAKGCSLKDVQDWMGHADIKMTCNIYGHLDLSRKKMTSEIIRETLAQAC